MQTGTPQTEATSRWKRLQRLLARRATDLFAISIVLVGVLSISGRLSEWWNTDSANVLDVSRSTAEVAGSSTTWGQNASPVLMTLGELPVSVQRVVITGDESLAVNALVNFCRDTLLRLPSQVAESPNQDAESKIIKGVESLIPVLEIADRGSVYRIDGENSQFVGLLLVGVTHNTADASRKITGWGIALPRGEDSWNIFLFDKTRPSASLASNLPTPTGVTPILSLMDESGGQLSAFERRVEAPVRQITEWRSFYTHAFLEDGWKTSRNWHEQEQGWTARFERRTEKRVEAVELVLRVSDRQRAFGVANSHIEMLKPN